MKRKRDDPPLSSKNSCAAESPVISRSLLAGIVAPMVNASELPFRILCRRFGATLAYTPMIDSVKFSKDPNYRVDPTCPFTSSVTNDFPLVPHFSANSPEDFCNAIKQIPPEFHHSIAYIDLNLGCPQRTAYQGHFGSYLLGENDRQLVKSIVRAAAADESIPFPISCKIRLLDDIESTVALVNDLFSAGASLITIHGRFRATWERDGKGARDGPAKLDWIKAVSERCRGDNRLIVSNGNVVDFSDVENNLASTKTDGIMSAEGILDNPALFFPAMRKIVKRWKKMGKKSAKSEKKRLKHKAELEAIEKTYFPIWGDFASIKISDLSDKSTDKISLAREYLDIVEEVAPRTLIRTVTFHVRRMMKDLLVKYQLLDECISCPSVGATRAVIDKVASYEANPDSFIFDSKKAKAEKEREERRKEEEGKRDRFEQRMKRKAKREGKSLDHYLKIGASIPTVETIAALKTIESSDARKQIWNDSNHGQHCINFHLGKCERGKGCAFLHVEPGRFGGGEKEVFAEEDVVAG